MTEFPFLMFCPSDYQSDTGDFTLEEHGAYTQLLWLAWNHPGCKIPDDDAAIARFLRITKHHWKTKLQERILAKFSRKIDEITGEIPTVILGNKADLLPPGDPGPPREVAGFPDNVEVIYTSARDGSKVEEAFQRLADMCISRAESAK